MKNYYDELEVNKNASKEVIEKVYKVLAKKYHPDTTQELDKIASEEKFKSISEAYEILSDDEKRKKYDLELENSNPTISYEDYIKVVNERNYLNTSLNNLKNKLNQTSGPINMNYNTNNSYNNSNEDFPHNTHTSNSVNQNSTRTGTTSYYYTNTGKKASAFDYYKYKIREFFFNVALLFLSVIVAILVINVFLDFNLFSLFF